jgi:hypothetical protein
LGSEYSDENGYCSCGASPDTFSNICWYINYKEYDAHCMIEPTYQEVSGACLPNENGENMWFVKTPDFNPYSEGNYEDYVDLMRHLRGWR